jgi:hypothetical protein
MQRIQKEYTSIKNNKIIEHASSSNMDTTVPYCTATSASSPQSQICQCNQSSEFTNLHTITAPTTLGGYTVPFSSTTYYYCDVS